MRCFGFLSLFIPALIAAGCSSSPDTGDSALRAAEHMAVAAQLDSSGQWNEAALEYSIVAGLYPETRYYEGAVRRAAILFSSPDNTIASDSTALYWLSAYTELQLPDEERHLLESHIRMIGERRRLLKLLEEQRTSADSMSALASERQLQLEEVMKKARAAEKRLEQELAQTRKELERLRAIDLEVGRDKETKKDD
jgi:hypothetical protein